jgi:hypothetical protein
MKIQEVLSTVARSATSHCPFGGCVIRTMAASCGAAHLGYLGARHADGEGKP